MSVPFEQSSALAALSEVRHGFFGRQGGRSTGIFASLNTSMSSGDDLNLVTHNRSQTIEMLGLHPGSLATVRQVHSNAVLLFTKPRNGNETADAMVTKVSGVTLGILTADCVPLLLADPHAGVIGAAHAGWKGAVNGIVAATVDAMIGLGADPARITAAVGPAISRANYEVGPQFAADLLARHPQAGSRITKPNGGREHFDLPGFVADQLRRAGVGRLHDLGICTYAAADRYFSHRRATHEGTTTGRQIALIGLA